MRPGQARFVTACQQLLALAAVLAVLTPAASVVSLDIVSVGPRRTGPGQHLRRHVVRHRHGGRPDGTVVDPVVEEYALHPRRGGAPLGDRPQARALADAAPGGDRAGRAGRSR